MIKQSIRRVTIFALVFAMMCSIGPKAFATDDQHLVIESDERGISSECLHSKVVELEDKLSNSEFAVAVFIDEFGNEAPLEVEYHIQVNPVFFTNGGGHSVAGIEYIVTATAKATRNTNTSGNVTVTLTMHWTDVFGVRNVLNRLTGTCSTHSITSSRISWGSSVNNLWAGSRNLGTVTNFNEEIGHTSTNLLGILRAEYRVTLTAGGTVSVVVMPTIFS